MRWLIQICLFLVSVNVVYCTFGYTKRHQYMWTQKHKFCAGKWQSPIALSSSKSVPLPIPAIEMISYHNLLAGPIYITNNGHSVALSIHKGLSDKPLPYIFGGLLDKGALYELEGLHFHWGMKNNRGSEHVLNGVKFPMEMHIIHRNMKYATQSEAVEHSDGLTVLGIFFQLQEADNQKLDAILKTFPHVTWVNNVTRMNASVTLASLLPHDTDTFYTYKGSLTTPPCNEAVTWVIFPMPVPISFRQMNKFRLLWNEDDILADNYRRLQELGNRKVYVRRVSEISSESEALSRFDANELDWYWQ